MTTLVSPTGEVRQAARPKKGCGKKVAHLTSVHPIRDIRIYQKECKTLVDAGYDVTLIGPHDKPECIGGVRIEPVHRSQGRRRRMTRTVWEVYRKALLSEARLCHFHDPELLPVGLLLKLAGKQVVYDAHENVSNDILTKQWIKPGVRRLVSASTRIVEKLAVRMFDAVIGATPAISATFPAGKTVLVQNYPIAGELVSEAEIPYRCRDEVVLYVGSINEMKGAREMVGAMEHLQSHSSAKLFLLGEVDPPSLRFELAKLPGWRRVEHLGFQDRRSVGAHSGRARVGLVLFHPIPNYDDSRPNKLFEYMSAAIPVVASNFPEWTDLIEKIGCGLVVDPLDVHAIERAIAWILDHPAEAESMGQRGQAAVVSRYNWETQADNLLDLYDRLLP